MFFGHYMNSQSDQSMYFQNWSKGSHGWRLYILTKIVWIGFWKGAQLQVVDSRSAHISYKGNLR